MSQVARGTKLQMSIASVFTDVPGVNGLSIPATTEMIEDTHLTSGESKTFVPGHDEGTISFELNYDSSESTHSAMESDYLAKSARSYRVVQADGTTDSASYYVETFDKTFDRSDIQKASVTLRRSGGKTVS